MSEPRPATLSDFLAMPWCPAYEQLEDGGWRLTIAPLDDFEIFAPTWEELWDEWRTALRGHLRAYWKIGKPIPAPRPRVERLGENEWLLSWVGDCLCCGASPRADPT